jgi:hypothetical protein
LDRCGTHACDHVTVAWGGSAIRQPSSEQPPKPGYRFQFTALLKLTRTDTDDSYMALPAESGPVLAPDRLSVWPVEGGRYGLDATYHGATGFERAEAQRQNLQAANLSAPVRQELGDDSGL